MIKGLNESPRAIGLRILTKEDPSLVIYSCLVGWKETLQKVIALSSTKAEYVLIIEAIN